MNVLSPEQHPSTIFRDIMKHDFVIKIKDGTQLSINPAMVELEDFFFMMLSTKSEKLSRFFLQLSEGRIYLRLSPDTAVLAYIDIDYSRIKIMKSTPVLGKHLAVLRFIKGKTYEEIFHEDPKTIETWFDKLKRHCILSKFREFYKVGSTIGKGNFAKVIACSSVLNNDDYAVKIFDKKLILQDKFERVDRFYSELSFVRAQDDERSLPP